MSRLDTTWTVLDPSLGNDAAKQVFVAYARALPPVAGESAVIRMGPTGIGARSVAAEYGDASD